MEIPSKQQNYPDYHIVIKTWILYLIICRKKQIVIGIILYFILKNVFLP